MGRRAEDPKVIGESSDGIFSHSGNAQKINRAYLVDVAIQVREIPLMHGSQRGLSLRTHASLTFSQLKQIRARRRAKRIVHIDMFSLHAGEKLSVCTMDPAQHGRMAAFAPSSPTLAHRCFHSGIDEGSASIDRKALRKSSGTHPERRCAPFESYRMPPAATA